jgi:O-acetylserine/cysteine efflux transporter
VSPKSPDGKRSADTLPLRHFLLALVVVAVWGSNFVVIRIALDDLPPLLFATLRFMLALLPAVLFLRRPPVPWTNLAMYGLFIGVGQFGLIYIAMDGHISPGLASVVVQFQAFFTIALAMKLSGERLRGYQWCALLLAAVGLGVIVAHTDGTTTMLGLLLVLVAAFSWACGNITSTKAGQVNMLAYVVWSSAFAIPPLAVLAIAFEGWDARWNCSPNCLAACWFLYTTALTVL